MDESRKRVSAVIIKDNQILLIRRTKPNEEYLVFPGGGVEEGEDFGVAISREVKEELDIEITKYEPFFSFNENHFFFVKEYHGTPKIGLHSPEKERMNEQNQYHIEWLSLSSLETTKNVFPREVLSKIVQGALGGV